MPLPHFRPAQWSLFLAAIALPALSPQAFGLTVTGYSSAKNDRFASGYPGAPVANTNAAFVGLGYDFSGVGWSSTDSTKSFVLLSPKHFLATVHYGGATTLNFQGGAGTPASYQQQSLQPTGYGTVFQGETQGDLALGTLKTTVAPSAGVASYAIYDGLAGSSPVLLYGHGPNGSSSPRMGVATVAGFNIGSGTDRNSFFATSRTDVQLEGGDSGSPAFVQWTDPAGVKQLALVGNNAAIDTTNGYNILNYLVRDENIAVMNTMMATDGYALRFVSNANTAWKGNTSRITTSGNWSNGTPTAASYLGFSAPDATSLSVNLQGGTTSARGLIFGTGGSGFTFSNGTFSLGRGGMNNYSANLQSFGTNFTLTEAQYWDGGNGGFDVSGNIANAGHLLVVQGAGPGTLSGVLSGTGGLAKDGSGILTLTGSNTYTGTTFLHNGALVVNNSAGSGTGSGQVKVEAGLLAGHGRVGGAVTLAAGSRLTAGSVTAGDAPTLDGSIQANNRLTLGGNVTLDGAFEFYLGALSDTAGFTQVTLDGASALLTLGGNSSFTLDASHFLGIDDPNSGNAFWESAHLWTILEVTGAGAGVSGDFSLVDPGTWLQGSFDLFWDNGDTLFLSYTPADVVPEPAAGLLLAVGGLMTALRTRRRAAA